MGDIGLRIRITGTVQGVGFRPFVYNLAKRLEVKGWVSNNASGVEIAVEGSQDLVHSFVSALRDKHPPLAVIDSVIVESCEFHGYLEFCIRASDGSQAKTAHIPPDIATCDNCRHELFTPSDNRYRYPFTNCTDCGPRYTIIKDIPYDRKSTTMQPFTMCSTCQEEYDAPSNRRFHAQPNACPICGPRYLLLDKEGQPLVESEHDLFEIVRNLVAAGKIIAIKGIGGYHLAVNAREETAVARLRARKVREDKAFAVMAGSLTAVKEECWVSTVEEDLLLSPASPIVLLAKSDGYSLAPSTAPGNKFIGIMMPYAPVHHLLLNENDFWVMTSGNLSDEPIAIDNEDALDRLKGIADYFLVHNRDIYCRADDSVVRAVFDLPYFVRRGRGYVPSPIRMKLAGPQVLAVGGELKNTFCLTRGNEAFLSSHVGDLENLATYQSFLDSIDHFKKLVNAQPELVAYDLHPEYLSTKYALALRLPKVAVQHHHAHIAAVMAEHQLPDPVIGVAFDGTGYGPDGTLWGGEFLVADLKGFKRLGHLDYMILPGGAKAIKEPWRLAMWLLSELYGQEFANSNIPIARSLPLGWELVLEAAKKGINAPLSSGAGRLFDACAALLGIRQVINYEGQAAVELELAAEGYDGKVLAYEVNHVGGKLIIDFRPVFAVICRELAKCQAVGQLAADFHATLADAIVTVVRRISRDTGITSAALSGGVFQNITILTKVVGMLKKHNFKIYLHRHTPPNDGCLALGQAAIAGERSR